MIGAVMGAVIDVALGEAVQEVSFHPFDHLGSIRATVRRTALGSRFMIAVDH